LGGGTVHGAEFSYPVKRLELRDADVIHWKILSNKGKSFNWTAFAYAY
jgi:hypothetical protein